MVVPTHHTLLFRLRLFDDPVHTPVFSCTLSRTTGLPLLTDPILSILKITRGAGVAILVDNHVVRTREQLNRLVSLGRFGKRPAALPISHDSAIKLVSSKKKIPVFDVLYCMHLSAVAHLTITVDQDEDDEDLQIHASSSASSISSSSSSSSATSTTKASSPSLFKRFGLSLAPSAKPERKLVSHYQDMEGSSVLDTELLLRRAGIPLPQSLRLQVREATAKLQQLRLQNQAGSPSGKPASLRAPTDDNRRKAIVFSVGSDDLDEPLYWEDERSEDVLYARSYYVPHMPNSADMLHRQQSLRAQQLGHRRQCSGSSFSSLARIYEEDEEL